jgi:hypothetical protein
MSCIVLASKRHPQRAHIKAYIYDQEGQKPYPRAVYAYGPGANAKRPKRDSPAVQRRSRLKRKNIISMNSVFNMALGIAYAAPVLKKIRHEQQTERQ